MGWVGHWSTIVWIVMLRINRFVKVVVSRFIFQALDSDIGYMFGLVAVIMVIRFHRHRRLGMMVDRMHLLDLHQWNWFVQLCRVESCGRGTGDQMMGNRSGLVGNHALQMVGNGCGGVMERCGVMVGNWGYTGGMVGNRNRVNRNRK